MDTRVNCRTFLKEKKGCLISSRNTMDGGIIGKSKSKSHVFDYKEGIDLGIGKDTEVFLPKTFEDNEAILPNVPIVATIEKIKSRKCGYRKLYPEVKFQSAI